MKREILNQCVKNVVAINQRREQEKVWAKHSTAYETAGLDLCRIRSLGKKQGKRRSPCSWLNIGGFQDLGLEEWKNNAKTNRKAGRLKQDHDLGSH